MTENTTTPKTYEPKMPTSKIWLPNTLILLVILGGGIYGFLSLGIILVPFFAGFIGAYLLNPLVGRAQHYRINRAFASFLLISGLLIGLVSLLLIALPFIQQELIFIAKAAPALMEKFNHWLDINIIQRFDIKLPSTDMASLHQHLGSQFSNIFTWFLKLFINLLDTGMVLANALAIIILTPIVAFYILKDWPKMSQTLDDLWPSRYAPLIRQELRKIDQTLQGYATGQLQVCMIDGLLYGLSLWLVIGLPHAWTVGILTGILCVIPYVGMLTGLLISISLALHADIAILPIFAVFAAIQTIDANMITPRLIGNQIGLHPVWIIFSLLAGATWFGFFGLLLALPTAAVLRIILRLFMVWYREKFR